MQRGVSLSPPRIWEDFYVAAQQLKQLSSVLRDDAQGHVSKALSPVLLDLRRQLEGSASARFGPLGRLALARASPALASALLPTKSAILVFAVHAIVLASDFQATSEGGFVEEEWPLCLPALWATETFNKFAFTYRGQDGKVMTVRAHTLQDGELVVTFAFGASEVHSLRLVVNEFVGNSTEKSLSLSKVTDLQRAVEQAIATAAGSAMNKPVPVMSDQPREAFQRPQQPVKPPPPDFRDFPPDFPPGQFPLTRPGVGGFEGDLTPRGGSSLFGPGNPEFDRQFRGSSRPTFPPGPAPRVPEARFDPYGPGPAYRGEPDWDEFPPPGPPRQRGGRPPPGRYGGWGDDFL